MSRHTWLFGGVALAAFMASDIGPIFAQDEVIVTARRKEESLQTVPVAVSAFSGEELKERTVLDIEDVGNFTPNVRIVPMAASPNSAQIAIRGQVQNDSLITLDQSVGVYVDDVYMARAWGVLTDLVDVERIEVLKGPQGTLYGRNTTGGAIKIVNNKADPSSDGYTGSIKASYGNYDAVGLEGVLNIPVVEDVFALRYAGTYNRHDGYTRTIIVNQNAGLAPIAERDTNDRDSQYHRLSATLNASDDFTIWLSGFYYRYRSNGQFYVNRAGDILSFGAPQRSSFQLADGFYTGISDIVPFANARSWGVSGTAEYRFADNLSTKLILGYSDNESLSNFNTDGGAANLGLTILQFDTTLDQTQDQFTAEWQLNGTSFDDRLDWILGAYYFSEEGDDATKGANILFGNRFGRTFGATAENKSYSGFGNITFAVTDKFNISGGLRWTHDSKFMDSRNSRAIVPNGPELCVFTPGAPDTTVDATTCSFHPKDTFSFISWSGGVDYQLTDNTFTYVKGAHASRSGGQQLRAIDSSSGTPFSEELATDIEAGIKTDLLDNRLRINAAFFHTWYKDIQFSLIVITPVGNTTQVINIGKAAVNGGEVEATINVTDNLTVLGSFGYLNLNLKDAGGAPVTLTRPKVQGAASVIYRRPVSDLGTALLRGDWTYRSAFESSPGLPGLARIKSESIFDGRVGFEFNNGVQIAVFGKNLGDERKYHGTIPLLPPTLLAGQVIDPRTYGVEVGYKF